MSARMYRDNEDELWLDPGSGELLALDGQVLRVLRGKWPARPLADIEAEFGPLRELTAEQDVQGLRPGWAEDGTDPLA